MAAIQTSTNKKIGLSEATVITKETNETNKVPFGLYFLDVFFFLLHKLCLSTCKGKYVWEIGGPRVAETT